MVGSRRTLCLGECPVVAGECGDDWLAVGRRGGVGQVLLVRLRDLAGLGTQVGARQLC